ncbi:MAG: cell division protein FtsL [Pseudomonadota bacterium]
MRRLAGVMAILTAVLGIGVYMVKDDTRRLRASVDAQTRALEALRREVTSLKAQRAHLARPSRIQALARRLRMMAPRHAMTLPRRKTPLPRVKHLDQTRTNAQRDARLTFRRPPPR